MSKYMNNMKHSLPEMRHFTHKYLWEIFTLIALVVAGFSSWSGFFINGLGMSLLFVFLGLLAGIIFPSQVRAVIHKFYEMTTMKNQPGRIAIGCLKIILSFVFAFLYFGIIGLLASNAYYHFSKQARGENEHDRAA